MASSHPNLLPRLRAWFHLSQSELGHCLGLSREMVSQVERGVRGMPLPASLPQAALTLAQHVTSTAGASAETPVATTLRRQHRACQRQADQLAFALSLLPERAEWARRRLGALPTLRAALALPEATPPTWLTSFEAEAHAELARSGATAQALLQARREGLLAEAAEIERLLAADENAVQTKTPPSPAA